MKIRVEKVRVWKRIIYFENDKVRIGKTMTNSRLELCIVYSPKSA